MLAVDPSRTYQPPPPGLRGDGRLRRFRRRGLGRDPWPPRTTSLSRSDSTTPSQLTWPPGCWAEVPSGPADADSWTAKTEPSALASLAQRLSRGPQPRPVVREGRGEPIRA